MYYPGMALQNFTIVEEDTAEWGSYSLPYINLTGNVLEDVVSCKLSTLLTLDMSIPYYDIGYNNIRVFSRNTFPHLTTLVLSKNQLTELAYNELPSLKLLLLGRNID